MKINIIVANCFYGGIGKSNKLPFSFKKDLAYFSKITKGKPYNTNGLLMGRNTWDSLPIKPLPYRHNYVVSRSMTGEFVFDNIDYCLEHCRYQNLNTLWVIGGEQIYNTFIFDEKYNTQLDNIYMTKIYEKYDCDKFFPVNHICNGENWKQVSSLSKYERGTQLDFCVYENVKKSTEL